MRFFYDQINKYLRQHLVFDDKQKVSIEFI